MANNPFDEFDSPSAGVTSNPFDEFDATVSPALPTRAERQGIGDALRERYYKARGAILDAGINPLGLAYASLVANGQIAGAVNDAVLNPVMNWVGRSIVPDPEVRGNIGQFFSEMPGLRSAVQAYQGFAQENPKTSLGVESAFNIASLVPQGKIAKTAVPKIAEGVGGIAKDAAMKYTSLKGPELIEKAKTEAINKGFQKYIRPSYAGKSDAKLSANWYQDANTATRELVDRYQQEPLSKADDIMQEMSNRIYSSKTDIWKEVQKRSGSATESGILVDMEPVYKDLWEIGTNPDLLASNKALAEAYIEESRNLSSRGRYVTPESAEFMLSQMNGRSKPFWNDPKGNINALVPARAGNTLRKQLFSSMDGLGPEYADLRNKYGSFLGIERDVQNRATQYGRKNQFGFFDLGNMMAAKDFVVGLGEFASGNPSRLFGTAALMAAKTGMQGANDVANGIRKMFKDVEYYSAVQRKFGRANLRGDTSGSRPTPMSLPMPERGFTLQGTPYGDDVVQAKFTSRPIPLLEGSSVPPQGLLPPGETGFSLRSGMGSGPGVSGTAPVYTGEFYPPAVTTGAPAADMVGAPPSVHAMRLPVAVQQQGAGFTTRPATLLEQFATMDQLKQFLQARARQQQGIPTPMEFGPRFRPR